MEIAVRAKGYIEIIRMKITQLIMMFKSSGNLYHTIKYMFLLLLRLSHVLVDNLPIPVR